MSHKTITACWAIVVLLLATGLIFWPPALWAAIGFTTVYNLCFMYLTPKPQHFSLQVRFVYLGLLLLGQLPYCSLINWVQLFGTTALITVDYCPLARLLSLAPWNRNRALSLALVKTVLFSPPIPGSFIQVVNPDYATTTKGA